MSEVVELQLATDLSLYTLYDKYISLRIGRRHSWVHTGAWLTGATLTRHEIYIDIEP